MRKLIFILLAGIVPQFAPAAQRFDTFQRADLVPTTGDVAAVAADLAAADAALSAGLVLKADQTDFQTLETNVVDLTTEITETQSSFRTLETVVAENSNVWNLAETAVQATDATYTQTVALAAGAVQMNGDSFPIDTNTLVFANLIADGDVELYRNSATEYLSVGGDIVHCEYDQFGDNWLLFSDASAFFYTFPSVTGDPPLGNWGSGVTASFARTGKADFMDMLGAASITYLDGAIDSESAASDANATLLGNLIAGMEEFHAISLNGADPISAWSDIGAASAEDLAAVQADVDNLEDGTEDFETFNLNGEEFETAEDWGITYTNAIRLNQAVVVTNNATWDGYTITGSLTASNHVYLTVGDSIISPLATNGLASYEVVQSGKFSAIVTPMTNGVRVLLPYYGTDAYLHIEMIPTVGIPGEVTAATIEKVTLNGVQDRDEAKLPKTVTRVDLIEHQPNPESATRRDYVEAEVLGAKEYANAQILAYDENADKVVRCSMLRVGQDWVAEEVESDSGDRYLLVDADYSGEGEIRGNGRFYFSKNGHPLLSGGASAVYYGAGVDFVSLVKSNGYDIATVTISTNAVTAEPFLECTESLIHAEYLKCDTVASDWPTPSGGVYTLTVTTESKEKLYFKAGELTGESSDVRVEGDKLDLESKPIEMIDHGNGLTYHVVLSNGVFKIIQQ